MKSLRLDRIPGLDKAIHSARETEFKTRENGWLGLAFDIFGIKIRTMTVQDYVILDRENSPFLNRLEPTMSDLTMFLWVMSQAHENYCERKGWRKFFPWIQSAECFFFARKIRRKFGSNVPESSEPAVMRCFQFIDEMFYDAPASVAGASESCLPFFAGWFDVLQSEYNFSDEEIWKMTLPRLFQRLKAVAHRNNPNTPNFNRRTDAIKQKILNGLAEGRFTIDDLEEGKIDFSEN